MREVLSAGYALRALLEGEVFGIAVIVILIGLLVAKELVSLSAEKRAVRVGKALNIAILPLLVVYILVIAEKFRSLLIQ